MSDLRTYARLVRLPNLPSALADIFLGALVTSALPARWAPFALLLLASGCLYSAGMVWNDFFDLEQDRRERPDRPLPSGRVSPRAAAWLGAGLMGAGLFFALLAGQVKVWRGEADSPLRPFVIALLLTLAIFAYDGWLKRTALGPASMGLCRFLNVLLGLAVSPPVAWVAAGHLALVVGLYVVGLTWFARTEARQSNAAVLAGAAGTMLTSLVLALALPVHQANPGDCSPLFPYLLVALGFALALPIQQAIAAPTPSKVQAAVKRCLFCLIVLDAILATALVGTVGMIVLLLLAPALYLNRRSWLYAT
jgi:4-hydroxybenzoate polyprenyltransferase